MGNYTWETGAPLYNHISGCKALTDRNIDTIYFYGDSYMRQMYAALLITLNGNYRNGSRSDESYAVSKGSRKCLFHSQFNEKYCGVHQLNYLGVVCDGRVQLRAILSNLDLGHCKARTRGKAISLFSTGNHHIASGGGGRLGVNDPVMHAENFKNNFCKELQELHSNASVSGNSNSNSNGKSTTTVVDAGISRGAGAGASAGAGGGLSSCSFWWVSTHHRIIGWFPDERGLY